MVASEVKSSDADLLAAAEGLRGGRLDALNAEVASRIAVWSRAKELLESQLEA